MKEGALCRCHTTYYRIFYYVAKIPQLHPGGRRALHGSQPNITRTINLLEQELGCRLFERSTGGWP